MIDPRYIVESKEELRLPNPRSCTRIQHWSLARDVNGMREITVTAHVVGSGERFVTMDYLREAVTPASARLLASLLISAAYAAETMAAPPLEIGE